MKNYHITFGIFGVTLLLGVVALIDGSEQLASAYFGGAAGWFGYGLQEMRNG